MNTVLVTGATGNVGSGVVRELAGRGLPVRAFTRDPDRARSLLGGQVDVVSGDFDDPGAVEVAVKGVDQLFLASPNHPRQLAWETAVIDAATAAGARRIVKLSAIGAEVGSPLAFWDTHGRLEAHLATAAPAAVVLRPAFYMSGLLATAAGVQQTSRLFLPAGGAKVAMIDTSDVADVAATVLTRDGDDGRTYRLTGAESLTFADVAARLSDAVGRPIEFVDVPDEAAHGAMVGAGMPPWLADNLVTLFGLIRAGALAETTGDVREVLGREPRPFTAFATDQASFF